MILGEPVTFGLDGLELHRRVDAVPDVGLGFFRDTDMCTAACPEWMTLRQWNVDHPIGSLGGTVGALGVDCGTCGTCCCWGGRSLVGASGLGRALCGCGLRSSDPICCLVTLEPSAFRLARFLAGLAERLVSGGLGFRTVGFVSLLGAFGPLLRSRGRSDLALALE
jgi:hypothetical protein